ncbi:tetratricopeptide repeat protein [Flavobacterium sp. RHBU_3]|uniref:type IX secretion system periplasmic lipoprotein PorW/SprE n=1 Tax=Flavobacterium sp. RHBU_3 TaxID=3391184 RepID=UPI00398533E5
MLKTSNYKYILALGAAAFAIACSTKKDSFMSRNYHALSTRDNILFNGRNALATGITELKTTMADNYWDILPVERMQRPPDEMEPTDKRNANFERAEAKATKAIQKHSMDIGGQERNPQIDEAHLLLGQARYYDNRFLPAMEAFNYVLYKYPTSSRIDEVKVWREKTNIRLDNTGVAIKNLKKLLEEKKGKMDEQIYSDANAMMGQAYIQEEYADSATVALIEAVKHTKDNEKKSRYYFIIGQLYSKQNNTDSAYAYFQRVIDMKRKSPRIYTIHAHAMQASQFNYKTGDTLAFMEKYRELLEDRENRPFLDVINHQIALFYDKQGLNKQAVEYYNKSLRKKGQDRYLIASNYRNIAEINFEEAKYLKAGKYYDSTLVSMDFRTREYKAIKKKRDNLEDVIKYEGIANTNDSILNAVALTDDARVAYYKEYIEKLKVQDELAKKKAEAEAQKQANIAANAAAMGGRGNDAMTSISGTPGGKGSDTNAMVAGKQTGALTPALSTGTNNRPTTSAGGTAAAATGPFYFYTPANVSYGKITFQSKWGKRPLADNWRVASEIKGGFKADEDPSAENDSLANAKDGDKPLEPRYDPNFYISQLPSDQKVLDSLAKDRNFAYFQLGAIYKDKFKENQRAADKLERLLTLNPEERLIAPSLYNLYRIYETSDPAKAEMYKQRILTEYPDSRYAAIIKNPNPEALYAGSPEAIYKKLYEQYTDGQVREVYAVIGEYIDSYEGEDILPKLELLKAKLIARLQGVDEYKKALNYVALTYANAKEGKEADNMLKKDVPALEKLAFGSTPTTYKLMFKFDANDPRIAKLTKTIQQFIKDNNNNRITLSNDIYTVKDNILVVHGLINKLAAVDVVSVLKDYKDYKIAETPIIISSEDYKVIQVKKNFEQYQPVK